MVRHSSPLAIPVFIGGLGDLVKSEIESRIFTSKTALAAEHIPNLDDCPVKVFLPMCYFVPFYGTKLPFRGQYIAVTRQ